MDKTIVPTNLLCWPKVKNLIPDHKLIVLALWQNPFVTPCGVYFIDLDMFSGMLGFNKLNVEQAIYDFAEKDILKFDHETSELLNCDWWRFHKCESPAQISMIQKAVNKVQSNKLKTEFFIRIKHVSNKIIDLRSNYNETQPTPNYNTTPTPTDGADAPSEFSEESAKLSSSGCHLIFDKGIDQNLHQQLTALLQYVDPKLAQQMIDVLAGMGSKVHHPIMLIKKFIANPVDFDLSPGLAISRKRESEKIAAAKRVAENQRKNQGKNFAAAEKFKEERGRLGI